MLPLEYSLGEVQQVSQMFQMYMLQLQHLQQLHQSETGSEKKMANVRTIDLEMKDGKD